MMKVTPKKRLGQHFLTDQNIARKIVSSLSDAQSNVLEIGPGTGVLTKYLLKNTGYQVHVIEVDKESVRFLKDNYRELGNRIYDADFLKWKIPDSIPDKFSIIGNFPYNISSQIFFKILENKKRIPEVVCMVQKEVAERISAAHGNKTYGILSVLLQAYFDIEYLFTVSEHVFNPPPKVKSAVIRLKRNEVEDLGCDEELFFTVVKTAFQQRRKMLRNSLKELCQNLPSDFKEKRPEQLSVNDFIELSCAINKLKHRNDEL